MSTARRTAATISIAAVGAAALLGSATRASAGFTYVSAYTFTSAAGDYIGQGATASYAQPSATFGISGTAGDLTVSVTTATEWWYITLAAPIGQQLQAGTTYTGAERAAFRTGSAPGLDVYGDGRGCNQVYGSFTVNSLATDSSGNVTSVDATFTQNCEQPTAPPLQGHVTYRVPQATTTSTSLSASATSTYAGSSVTLQATVTPAAGSTPTGSVSFSDGGTVIGSASLDAGGVATLTTSALGVGSHSITATYGGDPGDAGSTSGTVGVTVLRYGSLSSLTSSAGCSAVNRAVTFTVAVSGSPAGGPMPGGSVTFLDGGVTLASATVDLNGHASLTTSALHVGTHSISGVYSGDGAHAGSTSNTVQVTIVRKHC